MSEEEFLNKGAFRKEELYSFLLTFGFSTYEDFRFKLEADHQLRLYQIRVRLFGETPQNFLAKMDMAMDDISAQIVAALTGQRIISPSESDAEYQDSPGKRLVE